MQTARRPLRLERVRESGRPVEGFRACLAALILPRGQWKCLHFHGGLDQLVLKDASGCCVER